MVEIIGTESMETIIAKKGKLLVTDDYLKLLLDEANKKLKRNCKKLEELYLSL